MGTLSVTRRHASGHHPTDGGFTIVEVMVAMVVFVVVSTATITLLVTGLRTIRENTDRVMAANIARWQVEDLRFAGTSAIPIGLTEGGPAGADPAFEVRTTANWVGFDQTTSACVSAEPGQAYLRVTVEVSSPDLRSPEVIDTVIQPDSTESNSGTGAAAISVINQVGQPVTDVTVTGVDANHPTNGFTLTTGIDGCLFIPNLQPTGSLVVTVSFAGTPAHVASTPTGTEQVVTITDGGLARPTFQYAPAASIVFVDAGGDFPLPEGGGVSWQLNGTGEAVRTSALGATVSGLWPSTGGFTAWAGACSDSDPAAVPVPRQAFVLTAGSATSAALASAPVRLRGLPADTPVTARYVGPDATCETTTIDVGRSNDNGILRVGLPYGDWEFTAVADTDPEETETVPLDEPLRPGPEGLPPEPVTVEFTLADLVNPSPSPEATESSSAEPSFEPTAEPSP